MTLTQDILWIALPGGVRAEDDKRYLRLSVFVNPRLRSDEGMTLRQYPDFLDWGALMQPGLSMFTVRLDDGTEVRSVVTSNPPDAVLWRAFFHEEIPVRPYQFEDYSNRPIVSFPADAILKDIKTCYQQIAAKSPYDHPAIKKTTNDEEGQLSLEEAFGDLRKLHLPYEDDHTPLNDRLNASIERSRRDARRRSAQGVIGGGPYIPDGIGGAADPFFRTALFHYRPPMAKPVDLPQGPAARAGFEEEFDFHQMVSALGDFPQILRRLGLIIDLEIDAADLPPSSELAPRSLSVLPSWNSSLPRKQPGLTTWTADYYPWTKFIHSEQGGQTLFAAHSANGEFVAGLVNPGDELGLEQVDVDGAALKTLNLVETLGRAIKEESLAIDAPEKAGVPSLRTGSISIFRKGNANRRYESFVRSTKLNECLSSDPPIVTALYAEDLTRGYRMDVYEERSGKWHSLHQRIGSYATPGAPGVIPDDINDEGYVQASVTGPVRDQGVPRDPGEELYVHESLFSWDGWSLSAPRPGLSISRSARAPDPSDPDSMPQRVENTAMTRLGLETKFKVQPGTLPRLRFGQGYRIRLRAVDLAGNSPALEEANTLESVLPPPRELALIYRRFEPIPPPELIPCQLYSTDGNTEHPEATAYAEGESLERLVIRSNFELSSEEYVELRPAYRPYNDRHIAAPKASLQLVELHGLLDEALDAKSAGLTPQEIRERVLNVYETVALRESGSWNDQELPSVRFVRTGQEEGPGEGYAVHTEEQAILPYLPDPWSAGVVFQGLPGIAPDERLSIPFGGPIWYEAAPFRLRLIEGDGAPEWESSERVLKIYLPKSGIARVRISSMFAGDLDAMGLWQWLIEAAENGAVSFERLSELKQAIHDGRHWMFTPYRDITLVHAVQQPLAAPEPKLTANRSQGETVAWLQGEIYLHAPSTAKLDIVASWKEPRDELSLNANKNDLNVSAHVMEIPTVQDDGEPILLTYSDIVPDPLRLESDKILVFRADQAGEARKWHQEALDGLPASDTIRRRYHQNQINLASKITAHEFGDTKYRRVRYKVKATTRFREYFPQQMTTEELLRESEETVVDILSSARPAAPRVRYVLPTYAWEEGNGDEDGSLRSTRKGGGLRVYLDRPWWSSGDGEMLGVILGHDLSVPQEPLYNYSTHWGQDPVWQSPGLPMPRTASFKNSSHVYANVKMAELANTFVSVAVFPVKWDDSRELWYSDMELDTSDAYFPFIRLALARFQPNSLTDGHGNLDARMQLDLRLSSVVLADIVQTAPDRICTVTRIGVAPGGYGISVSGVTYTARRSTNGNLVIPASSQVEVNVQRRDTEIEDETIGWVDLPLRFMLDAGVPDALGRVVWQGQFQIPQEYLGETLRLVVQEFETLDAAVPSEVRDVTMTRLVYVDILQL
ncbi:hypothetical protein [Paenibacillus sp. R14(2021)]|uniref:hypothetical protein n=1 Tax=Paenibacillus sp. R14(2021) TaxID=2859228 RepID=UPI001C6155C3|nr:hypothetical protein [Paenibacillus sp. R14(2021)]